MTPTLNLLPHCTLELRPLRGDGPLQDRLWLLCSRDDRARPMWEVTLSTPMLHALLECLAEGQDTANAGTLQIRIYPDPELERSVMNWAGQQLARYAGGLVRPVGGLRGRHPEVMRSVGARFL
jgi:hypothetical protein